MRVATFNVNSIRARLPRVLEWLDATAPDVVLLQEIKVTADLFPRLEIEERGYGIELVGEPSYNGVAILSKRPLSEVARGLPGDADDRDARYIEAVVDGAFRVASVYVPNGGSVDGPRFPKKLAFFDRLRDRAVEAMKTPLPYILGGDFNVAPAARDVFDPEVCEGHVCFHPDERRKWRALVHPGLYDAYRCLRPDDPGFTWWHYRERAFQADTGLRIDQLLLSARVVDALTGVGVDRDERAKKGASDHAPLWCAIDPGLVATRRLA